MLAFFKFVKRRAVKIFSSMKEKLSTIARFQLFKRRQNVMLVVWRTVSVAGVVDKLENCVWYGCVALSNGRMEIM